METNQLWETAIEVCTKVMDAGGTAYITGGAARDLFIARQTNSISPPLVWKDVDIEVFGLEPVALEQLLLQKWKIDVVGKSFGVIKLHGIPIDISLPRRERKTGDGHADFVIEADPGMSITEAASRRDFTINAIYYEPLLGDWYDPFDGRQDILDQVLNPVSDRFTEDPLRVLRGMQFIARFGLNPTARCLEMCRGLSQDNLPRERVFEEWKKMLLLGKHIRKAWYFLRDIGWMERFYPELFALFSSQQNPKWHPEGSVGEHTALVVEAFTEGEFIDDDEKLVLGLAAVCHDLGKPETASFGPTKNNPDPHWTNKDHESHTGPAERFLARLTNETKLVEKVLALCREHMRPVAFYKNKADLQSFRRLALKVDMRQLEKLSRFDQGGRGAVNPPDESILAWFRAKAAEANVLFSKPIPLVMGRDLIAQFGMAPGKAMGELLKQLMELQLAGQFQTKEDGLNQATRLIPHP